MFDFINQLNIEQLLLASLTVSAAGIIGFWCKDVPKKIITLLQKQFTTKLIVTSNNLYYYNVLKYLELNYKDKKFRTFKVTNGKWGEMNESTLGIGYGGHFIRFEKHIIYICLEKHEAHGTNFDKETIILHKLGRSRKLFDRFYEITNRDLNSIDVIQLYQFCSNYWEPINKIPKRLLNTVFMPKNYKDDLLNGINNFINNESWYIDNGIPYHLGILLYGPPGTGKSTLIKAIASYLNYSICYLSVNYLHKINIAIAKLPKDTILVIEDIDTDAAINKRDKVISVDKDIENVGPVLITDDDFNNTHSITNLSDVLNAFDGICSTHNRILITTTNHIEKIDRALLRPGRIDIKVNVGYVNNEVFNQFTLRFFNKEDNNVILRDNISCAELQQLILEKKSYEEIINYVRI